MFIGQPEKIVFYVFDLDGQPKTGLAFTNAQIQVSQNGGAPANSTGTNGEIGLGQYWYLPAAAEVNSYVGPIAICALTKVGVSNAGFASDHVEVPSALHRAPNSMLDNCTYNFRKFLTGGRVRIFESAAALAAAVAGHADGVDGEIYRYTYVGTDRGDGVSSAFTISQELP